MKNIIPSFLTILALSGCGTSPDPTFYTLAPLSGATTTSIEGTIKVVQPDLPKFLDRPDFVSQSGLYQVNVNERVNWAEPLGSLIERVLASDLAARLPMASIETDADDETSAPRLIIESKIDQFNAVSKGEVSLSGELLITDLKKGGTVKSIPFNLRAADGLGHPSSVASALSELIGQYADLIVTHLIFVDQRL